jgi:hypothetical protein
MGQNMRPLDNNISNTYTVDGEQYTKVQDMSNKKQTSVKKKSSGSKKTPAKKSVQAKNVKPVTVGVNTPFLQEVRYLLSRLKTWFIN